MRILLFGHEGGFGSAISSFFREAGHEVIGIGRGEQPPDGPGSFDVCFLSVPASEIKGCARVVRGCKVVEISSVKSPMVELSGKVVSIHPLFGPRSLGDRRFRDIAYIDGISIPGGEEITRRLFPGFRLVHMTAEEHDRLMVELLIKPYLVSRVAEGLLGPVKGAMTPSRSALDGIAGIGRMEGSTVLNETIRLNPFYLEALEELDSAVRKTIGIFR